MFNDGGTNQQNVESQNAPSLAFTATPILGNTNFDVKSDIRPGTDVADGFPAYPYLSVESLLFFQGMISTAVSPFNVLPGTSSGQQSTGGVSTQQDATGTTRLAQGYQPATG
jgi:hypothetical protein